ncbi:flagellar hook-associated protein 3 [Bacillus cereus]|nr:flagellar hook-associated protein 3 [Bacillus cereus]
MRVSTFQNANWAKNQMMDLNVQQQYYRNQVTSGKKNLLMSEDPLAASKSFAIQHSLANIEQMQKDIADSRNVLSQTENTLQGIVKSLARVEQLTLQAVNGTNSPNELKASAAEIDQLLKQVVYLANKQEQGRYIFGGDSASKPPFAEDGTYQGGENDVTWKLNDGYELKMFRNGKDLLEPVIKTLTKIRDVMQNGDQDALESVMGENKKNLDNILNRTTEVGSILNTVDTFKTILSEQNLALQENRKEIEDVDLAYINATYEATLKAVSTMSKTSILDYI